MTLQLCNPVDLEPSEPITLRLEDLSRAANSAVWAIEYNPKDVQRKRLDHLIFKLDKTRAAICNHLTHLNN